MEPKISLAFFAALTSTGDPSAPACDALARLNGEPMVVAASDTLSAAADDCAAPDAMLLGPLALLGSGDDSALATGDGDFFV
jgi:hypothetical protein